MADHPRSPGTPPRIELMDWIPDWAGYTWTATNQRQRTPIPDPNLLQPTPQVHQTRSTSQFGDSQATSTFSVEIGPVKKNKEQRIIDRPSPDRTVNRQLRGIHLFVRSDPLIGMITINATLGTGLYWRGGQILELGGPLAVLLSLLFVGCLSWAVMQCITEMLCIWPIPGALSIYVSEFVDVELGIAVGVTYWFTYSMSFAAAVATSAAEFNFWSGIADKPGIQGGIIYFLIPLGLVLLNALSIRIYGPLEVVSGTIKILFLIVIIVFLIAINVGAGPRPTRSMGAQYWNKPTDFDHEAASNWFISLLMSVSIATFAYVGVEVVAASALEARWPQPSADPESPIDGPPRRKQSVVGSTVKFSAIFIPVLATIAYTVSGVLGTLDISREDCQLPRVSWLNHEPNCMKPVTRASFVIIASNSEIPHLKDVFNAFLVFTCLTCASTNLYVSSRTLFGLTSRLDGGPNQRWFLRIFALLGKTNSHRVPLRAMLFSAVAFWWVPFLQLINGPGTSGARSTVNMFIEVLSEMSSIGDVIVWACECLAFIRFYHCIQKHRDFIRSEKVPLVQRDEPDFPYRSPGQPFLAYVALTGCLFVLLVANGAALWNGFYLLPFLAAYLTGNTNPKHTPSTVRYSIITTATLATAALAALVAEGNAETKRTPSDGISIKVDTEGNVSLQRRCHIIIFGIF
ncbi:proline-specific permease [Penicillium capsulatum]|nr:proline-specific permease [Penicillium capsulatum]